MKERGRRDADAGVVMCNFDSNPEQRSPGNEAPHIRDPSPTGHGKRPRQPCRCSIRPYSPPLIGPKSSFSRRSLAGDAENKEGHRASALTLHVRQHSSPISHRLSPSACPESQTPISTSANRLRCLSFPVMHFASYHV
jgi:hypothetical protein